MCLQLVITCVCVCVCVCVTEGRRSGWYDHSGHQRGTRRSGAERHKGKLLFISNGNCVCVNMMMLKLCVCVCVCVCFRAAMSRGSVTGWRWRRITWTRGRWPTQLTWWCWERSMEKAPTVCEHKHYLQYVLYIYIYIIMCVLSCRQQLLSGSAQLLPVRRAGWRHVVWSFHEKTLD